MAKSKKGSRRAEDLADFQGTDADHEAIAKLADSARKANEKRGQNVGEISDEALDRHLKLIDGAELEWREARDKAAELQGVLRNRYKVAKGDGVDIEALKLARRIAERPSGEFVSEHRNVGRYLRAMGSPVGTQFGLFSFLDDQGEDGKPTPSAMDAELQGQHAYSNGEDRGNNPFQPGTQEHVDWGLGWNAAQTATAMKMKPGNGAAEAR